MIQISVFDDLRQLTTKTVPKYRPGSKEKWQTEITDTTLPESLLLEFYQLIQY